MSVALVIVQKTISGHKWTNTHAIQIGANTTGAPSDADLVTAGASVAITATSTTGTPPDIIHAIVAAERAMYPTDVTISGVLVTDGKSNSGTTPSTVYASMSANIVGAGFGGTSVGTALEPGGITLLVHRNLVGFSHKPGRLFLRAALGETYVQLAGARMIGWEGGAIPAGITTNINAAGGYLAPYLATGANVATASYVMPVYVTPKQKLLNSALPRVGTLQYGIPVVSWTVVGPVLRQVQRGRRRKTP